MAFNFPNGNFPKIINDDWMLVAAGNTEKWNGMTASWGGVGSLWHKPVVFVFIRPQRYTFGFTEANDTFSLSFFSPEHHDILVRAGSTSGRDTDKMKTLGLTASDKDGTVVFEEAKQTLICRKLFATTLNEADFLDKDVLKDCYPQKDFHTMYVAEVLDWIEK